MECNGSTEVDLCVIATTVPICVVCGEAEAEAGTHATDRCPPASRNARSPKARKSFWSSLQSTKASVDFLRKVDQFPKSKDPRRKPPPKLRRLLIAFAVTTSRQIIMT